MFKTSLKLKTDEEKSVNFTVEKNKLEEILKKALEMKTAGHSLAEIIEHTKLSAAEIEKL
jgi:ATP-dependent protease Clp ATPase subunit